MTIAQVKPRGEFWSFRRVEDIDVNWSGMNTKIIFELHGDYLTLTIHIDGRGAGDDNVLNKNFAELYAFYDRHRWGSEHPGIDHVERDISDYLFADVWSKFKSEVLHDFSFHAKIDNTIIDNEFAFFGDFRGVVLLRGNKGDCLNPVGHHFAEREDGVFSTLDEQNKAIAKSLAILPAHIKNIKMQYCACTMLRDRATYVSTLGRRPATWGESQESVPVNYVFIFEHDQPWQTGRLIQRLNYLGVLRHMTLRDIVNIRISGIHLGEQEEDLDQISISLEKEGPGSHGTQINRISDHFAQWCNDFAKSLHDDGVSLRKRIGRCRLARDYFEIYVGALACKRIESYQPYDEFVSERLYPAFHFIDRMSMRLENLRERSEGLNERIAQRHEQEANHQAHRLARVVESVAISYYGGYMIYNIIGDGKFVVTDELVLKWKALIFAGSGLAALLYFLSGASVSGWFLKRAERGKGQGGRDH
jgi:hypothetical protein